MKRAELFKKDLPAEVAARLRKQAPLALDCEMMGLNPHRDRLCLVQIAAGDTRVILQIDESQPYPELKALLEDTAVLKIFHFARMDCLFLRHRLDINVQGIFCTKLASRLARTFTDRHGLKELVRSICGETMDKTNQTSDWGRPELTDDQLYYAEGDVKYLFELRDHLTEMLKREGRLELALECMAFLPTHVALDQLGYDHVFDH